MSLVSSDPCKERCSVCGSRCFGCNGHTRTATCGRKTLPDLHSCQQGHVWGTQADQREVLRANERETRREVLENIKYCVRCVRAVEKLGV